METYLFQLDVFSNEQMLIVEPGDELGPQEGRQDSWTYKKIRNRQKNKFTGDTNVERRYEDE